MRFLDNMATFGRRMSGRAAPASPPGKTALRKLVIIGLPRSGTTYLMTLLNSHPAVFCSGEQYNPHAIVGVGDDIVRELEPVFQRDFAPIDFLDRFFEANALPELSCVGFKFMIGHNISVLNEIAARPDLTLVYVWRENKLAQVSSLIKAAQTKNWAQVTTTNTQEEKIQAGPRQISQRWHEYETFDHLFAPWFDALPHNKIKLEYREMFRDGFSARICHLLGIEPVEEMKSPLVKQGQNRILDRFKYSKMIDRYFTELGLSHWLEDEI